MTASHHVYPGLTTHDNAARLVETGHALLRQQRQCDLRNDELFEVELFNVFGDAQTVVLYSRDSATHQRQCVVVALMYALHRLDAVPHQPHLEAPEDAYRAAVLLCAYRLSLLPDPVRAITRYARRPR